MDHFQYCDGALWCENVPADQVAKEHGTPAYVYSRQTFVGHFQRLRAAFAPLDPLICYAIKSCQNIHICRMLHELGSGFDVVSGGELFRAMHIGADPSKIVYAGVGKTDDELNAALDAGIGLFNVESESELKVLGELAHARGLVADAALRVNPDVDPHTHRYTTTGKKETKFGVDLERARRVIHSSADRPGVRLRGIHLHIGSPVHTVEPYVQSVGRGVELLHQLQRDGLPTDTLNIGGGYGAYYGDVESASPVDYADAILPLLRNAGLRIIIEPGRAIAANAGILLTRVLHVKRSGDRRFIIIDASMNDLIRPALYGAYHFVWPVNAANRAPTSRGPDQPFDDLQLCDVVGPVCESSDFIAKDRLLPPVQRGDLLAVFGAGAYASVMASQYNSRPRSPELLIHDETIQLIRRRETCEDLIATEEHNAE